jgi:hypothetical protein
MERCPIRGGSTLLGNDFGNGTDEMIPKMTSNHYYYLKGLGTHSALPI